VARQPRIEFPGAVYYLANQGDSGDAVFKSDDDRELFLQTLAETCRKTGWEVLAYSLMPNLFHLVVRTPQPNLVTGMKWLLGTYTIKFNRRHQVLGHLFAGRYRSLLVEPVAPYLPAVCDFVHLAPVQAWRAKSGLRLPELAWNSFPEHLKPSSERPAWLNTAVLFGLMGLEDSPAGREQFAQATEAARSGPANPLWAQVRRGWRLGGPDYRRELLGRVAAPGPNSATPGRELTRERAELIVREELAALGWNNADLGRLPKGDAEKIRIARRVRAETTASLRWVGQRLNMGSWTSTANSLYRKEISPAAKPARPKRAKIRRAPAPKTPPAKPPRAAMEELPVHCL
jgi:putative transposase